jgi:hypothetical protein
MDWLDLSPTEPASDRGTDGRSVAPDMATNDGDLHTIASEVN